MYITEQYVEELNTGGKIGGIGGAIYGYKKAKAEGKGLLGRAGGALKGGAVGAVAGHATQAGFGIKDRKKPSALGKFIKKNNPFRPKTTTEKIGGGIKKIGSGISSAAGKIKRSVGNELKDVKQSYKELY